MVYSRQLLYVDARNFDARFEVGAALQRHELIARAPTRHALTANAADGAKWARIAIRATEAKTRLLQDINLIDRTIGTLFIDDGKPVERISGAELQKRFEAFNVTDSELASEAQAAAVQRRGGALDAARAATDSGREPD